MEKVENFFKFTSKSLKFYSHKRKGTMRILLAFATLWVAASGMAISTNETEPPEPECFGAKQIINTGEVTSAVEFYAGEVDFSIDLFKKVYADNGGIKSKKPQNVFFSPFSVHSALLLAYFGSAGETQKNLRRSPKTRRDGQGHCNSILQSYTDATSSLQCS